MAILALLKRIPLLIGLILILALCAITLLVELDIASGIESSSASGDGDTPPDIGDTDVPPPAYDNAYCGRVGQWDAENPFRGWPTDNATLQNSGFIFMYFCDVNYGFSWEHEGLDFAWYLGTNAVATADAEIIQAGSHYALGNMVLLCSSGFCARYGHLDRIEPAVLAGGTVTKGQIVGQVGTTGNSTGVHLHYDIYDAIGFVDPFPTLFK